MSELHTLDGLLVESVPPQFALHPFGIFTTFVLVDASVLGWRDHVDRLMHGSRELWGHELDEQQLVQCLNAHAAHLEGPATVRITVYPARLSMIRPSEAQGARILVSSRATTFPFLPESDFTVGTSQFQRELPGVKSTAVLGQIRLRRDAQLAGHDDVLFCHGSQALEGATWAVVSWRDGEVATPGDGVLPSITTKHLGLVAEELGWRFHVRAVTLAELARAELVQAASVAHPARSIERVDGTILSVNHSLLLDISRIYSGLPRSPMVGVPR